MNLGQLKNSIFSKVINSLGWKTRRKIVVFESDDWGSIRMASKEDFNFFKEKGFPVDHCNYNSNDRIENNTDLELLFEVLDSVRDKNNNGAVLTANNIVANPDFKAIKEADFLQYFYEPFPTTLERYPDSNQVLNLYKEGIRQKLFIPQFHGREHINIVNWMNALQAKKESALLAFDRQMFSLHTSGTVSSCHNEYLNAFGNPNEIALYQSIIREGLDLFHSIHGFRSESFIAPCYYWPSAINQTLLDHGVKFLQGSRVQKEPFDRGQKSFKKRYHFTGQKNKLDQIYLVRNASFEVSENPQKDWVDSCMAELADAFKFRKPAIVSVHRVNFIGSLNPENRSHSLKAFKILLKKIVQTWPEVEFLTSNELGQLIQG